MFETGSRIFFTWMMLVAAGGAVVATTWDGMIGMVILFCGVLGCGWEVARSLWEHHNRGIENRRDLIRARAAFGTQATQWDQATRYFLAREWPEMGVEFGEDSISYVLEDGVNTGILIPFLRAFIQDSSENSFVDVRKYNDDKWLQEKFGVSRDVVRQQWKLTTDFLLRKQFLLEGSMAGNQTWRWPTAEHYKIMRRRYMNVTPLREIES